MRSCIQLVSLTLFVGAACTAVGQGPEATGGDPPESTPPGAPPPQPVPPLPVPEDFCAGSGPIVGLPQAPPTDACETTAFDRAVCSCTDVEVAGYLRVGGIEGGVPVGGLGANGRVRVDGYIDVAGDLTVAGSDSLGFFGYLRAGGALAAAGSVSAHGQDFIAGYLETGADTRIAGDLRLLGYATVGGDFAQPAGRARPVVMHVGGAIVPGPVAVEPPCPCEPDQLIDLATPIADARLGNDNGSLTPPLAEGALRDTIGFTQLTLPCGIYYLDEISGIGYVDLRIEGRVGLFVGGDIDTIGFLRITLAPDAELDLLVGGDLVSIGAGMLGDPARPGATRVYVAGSGDLAITGFELFTGNVYAPRARIRGTGATFVQGSLFGRAIDIPGFLDVGYDPSVRGDACDPVIL